jgi:glycerol-3-phosphate O-acyltransferase
VSGTVELPLWLVLLFAVLSSLALVNHFVLPGIRWFVRRRVNRVIDEVNARIKLELPRFQLTKRDVLVDRLTYDPEVLKAVEKAAAERNITRDGVMGQVVAYAREMVPAFNAFFYFRVGYAAARRFVRMIYRVRLGYAHHKAIAEVPEKSAVVFFINHRSNMDYLLVTYLASRTAALSYGAGEWARLWPLRNLLRFAGAYILRRDASDPVYRKVLERYVQIATQSLVPHAIFAEGQLSRTGGVHKAKLGLLGYIVRNFDPEGPYDILFYPVGTNFDRVVEEKTLVTNPDTDYRNRSGLFVAGVVLGFLRYLIWRKLTGKWHGYGVACANFAEPLSLKEWAREREVNFAQLEKRQLFARVEELAGDIMKRVAAVIPVLGVPLVSTVILEAENGLSEEDVKTKAYELIMDLKWNGAHMALGRHGGEQAIKDAMAMLKGRHLVETDNEGSIRVVEREKPMLQYYANSIAHLRSGATWEPE